MYVRISYDIHNNKKRAILPYYTEREKTTENYGSQHNMRCEELTNSIIRVSISRLLPPKYYF